MLESFHFGLYFQTKEQKIQTLIPSDEIIKSISQFKYRNLEKEQRKAWKKNFSTLSCSSVHQSHGSSNETLSVYK